jgi:hypothetical protein
VGLLCHRLNHTICGSLLNGLKNNTHYAQDEESIILEGGTMRHGLSRGKSHICL